MVLEIFVVLVFVVMCVVTMVIGIFAVMLVDDISFAMSVVVTPGVVVVETVVLIPDIVSC